MICAILSQGPGLTHKPRLLTLCIAPENARQTHLPSVSLTHLHWHGLPPAFHNPERLLLPPSSCLNTPSLESPSYANLQSQFSPVILSYTILGFAFILLLTVDNSTCICLCLCLCHWSRKRFASLVHGSIPRLSVAPGTWCALTKMYTWCIT